MTTKTKPPAKPLRDQIVAYLAGRDQATLKQIAAATSERDFPSRVTTELNKLRTDALVECEKKKGKNELWYWLAAPAQATPRDNSQPAVEQNTGSSAADDDSALPAAGAAVQPQPAPAAAASLSAAPAAADVKPRSTFNAGPRDREQARGDYSALGVLADIRAAVGDPEGKLMLPELVQRVRSVVKSEAEAAGELVRVRNLLRKGLGDNARESSTIACAVAAADRLARSRIDTADARCASETLAQVVDTGALDTSDMDLPELAKRAAAQLADKNVELLEQARIVVALRDTITQRTAELNNAQALVAKLEHLLQSARNEAEHLRAHSGTAAAVGYIVLSDLTSVIDIEHAKDTAAVELETYGGEPYVCAVVPVLKPRKTVVFDATETSIPTAA